MTSRWGKCLVCQSDMQGSATCVNCLREFNRIIASEEERAKLPKMKRPWDRYFWQHFRMREILLAQQGLSREEIKQNIREFIAAEDQRYEQQQKWNAEQILVSL